MNTEKILMKLEGVFETSSGWQARCPSHDDARASLSIAEVGGTTLMRCHAGCETVEIVAAMGLQMRDLFPDEAEERKLVATYDYTDENGELLYQMVRYSPKSFSARQPDGDGGWVYSMAGVKFVPYRLPTILGNQWVLVAEGEKDADTGCRDLRLPSTTNPLEREIGGKNTQLISLARWSCVVPDKDDAGKKHMQSVACSLFPVAKAIKIVQLPYGKDLTEWVDLGGTGSSSRRLPEPLPL